ncbi:MAG: 3-oxoacyl-ACP reductase [Sphingomonadales bacterium]|nr:3-oxoacyl-ACP reductase [Sphingomonadales bacterium]
MTSERTGMVAGKSVVVTGGGSGIGRATALLLVEEGARVIIGDVDVEGGRETVRQAQALGGEIVFLRTDVGVASDLQALIDAAVGQFGCLNGAVNNAGIDPEADPAQAWEESSYDRVAATNGKSVFVGMKLQIAQMLRDGGGSIVNTGSIVSFSGAPGRPAYVACKHALIGLTQTAALEFGGRGIRANAVCPGGILTPLMEKDQGLKAAIAASNPMGRLGDAREVAEAVVWLLSDRSSYVNGHGIVIDGGVSAG